MALRTDVFDQRPLPSVERDRDGGDNGHAREIGDHFIGSGHGTSLGSSCGQVKPRALLGSRRTAAADTTLGRLAVAAVAALRGGDLAPRRTVTR